MSNKISANLRNLRKNIKDIGGKIHSTFTGKPTKSSKMRQVNEMGNVKDVIKIDKATVTKITQKSQELENKLNRFEQKWDKFTESKNQLHAKQTHLQERVDTWNKKNSELARKYEAYDLETHPSQETLLKLDLESKALDTEKMKIEAEAAHYNAECDAAHAEENYLLAEEEALLSEQAELHSEIAQLHAENKTEVPTHFNLDQELKNFPVPTGKTKKSKTPSKADSKPPVVPSKNTKSEIKPVADVPYTDPEREKMKEDMGTPSHFDITTGQPLDAWEMHAKNQKEKQKAEAKRIEHEHSKPDKKKGFLSKIFSKGSKRDSSVQKTTSTSSASPTDMTVTQMLQETQNKYLGKIRDYNKKLDGLAQKIRNTQDLALKESLIQEMSIVATSLYSDGNRGCHVMLSGNAEVLRSQDPQLVPFSEKMAAIPHQANDLIRLGARIHALESRGVTGAFLEQLKQEYNNSPELDFMPALNPVIEFEKKVNPQILS